MESFIGCLVSLNCGETLGIYQGKVESINTKDNTITISNTFRNGLPYKVFQVTLRSQDITELRIIKKQDELAELKNIATNMLQTTYTPSTIKTQANQMHFNYPQIQSPSVTPNKNRYTNSSNHDSYSDNYHNSAINFLQEMDINHHYSGSTYTDLSGNIYPHKRNKYGKAKVIASFSDHANQSFKNPKQYVQHQRNSECFQRCEGDFDEDFDFEHNLSLFNKLPNNKSSTATNDLPSSPHHSRKEPKYKCDENIIKAPETSYRQIFFLSHPPNTIPNLPIHVSMNPTNCPSNLNNKPGLLPNLPPLLTNPPTPFATNTCLLGEYKTDAGFMIPGVSEGVRDLLITTATSHGFSMTRLVESYGRSICEATMQYLGGSARFEPKNAHQEPSIVLLLSTTCLSWVSAAALNCARTLANRSASVKLCLIPSHASKPSLLSSPLYKEEFELFAATATGCVVKDFQELSLDHGIDLIISTLNSPPQHNTHTNTNITENKLNSETKTILNKISKLITPIFTIEPSTSTTFPHHKRSFVCALPLWLPHHSLGQVCYCDLGIPEKLYHKAGVSYKSPFFDRFFLPLHPHDNHHNNGASSDSKRTSKDNRIQNNITLNIIK